MVDKKKDLIIVERNEFRSGRKQGTFKKWKTYSVMGDADYYVVQNVKWEMQTIFMPRFRRKGKYPT